ncbi:MAG TPA: hypothetical protein VFV11_01955 [Solimonas sp.]|nr:hypothetical protein [Solimonas sp.]
MPSTSFIRPVLLAAALATVGLLARASEPASHEVTIPTQPGQTVVVEWTGSIAPGASGAATNSCSGLPQLEDSHTVNLAVPEGAYAAVNVSAAFHIEWDTAGSDLVLTVLKDGATVASSDGGSPEENVIASNPSAGAFEALVCPFAATAPTTYRGKLTLTASSASSGAAPLAGTGNASGLPPRFQTYAPDTAKLGFGMFGGEATMDVNTQTGSLFYIGFLETMRLKLDDSTSPAQQTWELKNGTLNSKFTSDPILVADRDTGRVFAQQLIVGEGNSLSEFTDDDGETWTPGGGGGIRSGADHQSLGVGPYPADSLIPHPLYPNAVYYCSQDIALVFCSRSDDGGVSFAPGVPIYTLADCQGLHGHVKIAPDGTVYVPVSGCPSGLIDAANSQPAVVVSEDAGLTWTVRAVTSAALGSGGHGSDPSVGLAADNTLYLSYVSAIDNRIHMAVSKDRGLTWTEDVDLGSLAGITAAQFPAVVAGDGDRAAVTFFGTTFNGEGVDTAPNFNGVWHLYVATTYDGGKTYHVTNVTPGDPIQRGGICGDGFCRNLLDFYDMVIDPEGRLLISYEDGCVGGCPQGSPGTFSDQAVIARQSGGRRLLAAFDPVEPTRPGAPRVQGYRTANFAYIEWPQPDNGASPITAYTVHRGTSAASLAPLAVVGLKQGYVDTAVQAGQTYFYRVTATNARGESLPGNILELAVGTNAPTPGDACTLPGLKVAVDRTLEPEAQPATRDLAEVYIAEPEDMPGMIVFTLKTSVPLPPDLTQAVYHVYFDLPNGGKRYQLEMSGAGAEYGRLEQSPETGEHNTYVKEGDLDAASAFADGEVRMVLPKEAIGLRNTDVLQAVYADSWPSLVSSNITVDEAGYVDYKIVGNDFCKNGGVIAPPVIGGGGGSTVGGVTRDAGRFGGALPLLSVLLLLGLAGLRRRR